MGLLWVEVLFGFHTIYEAVAGLTNIFKPKVFGNAVGETSVRWQGSLGTAQLSLALLTLLFIGETGTQVGAKASAIALSFHAVITGRMMAAHLNGSAPIKPGMFYSHLFLCGCFVSHIWTVWAKN